MKEITVEALERAMGSPEEIIVFSDRDSGLRGVLSIDATRHGRSLGGTRVQDYPSVSAAIMDMTGFSRAVSLKSALAGAQCGGGKGAIIGDPATVKTKELLHAFGRFVQSLGGRYILTPDWGMSSADLAVVAEECAFVTGLASAHGGAGSPEPLVAYGVLEGLRGAFEATTEATSGGGDLTGVRVGVEGLAMSGPHLIELLVAEGAVVTAMDPSEELRRATAERFPGVTVVDSLRRLQETELDAYCPCAGSGTLTEEFASAGRVRVVCGAANGQLASPGVETAFTRRDIAYVPEFAANGGGVVHCLEERLGYDAERARATVATYRDTVRTILRTAVEEGRPATEVAVELAERRLKGEAGA
ncbi:valine dehydrogenase [Streptosporangium violaceochromogenes]|nr:valine dehydrogenase [Streptosporangium violaceochromogenes]